MLYKTTYNDLYKGVHSDVRMYANTLIFIFCFVIRLYHIIHVILDHSYYKSSRAYRVATTVGARPSYMFAVR